MRAWCLQTGAPLVVFCVGRPVLQAMCTFDGSRIALRLAHCTQPVFLSLRHLVAGATLPSPKGSPALPAGAAQSKSPLAESGNESGGSSGLTSSSSIRGRPVGALPVRKLQRSLTVPANVLGECTVVCADFFSFSSATTIQYFQSYSK